ncbi:dTDP-4-dehydrorhamnose 3,5-epimerase [Devosia sp. A369]
MAGVLEIQAQQHGDERGSFCEVWSAEDFARHGISIAFVQDNHSVSRQRGVMRGLHYQLPPFAQAKLVRVARGAIFDVAADIRPSSSTFGQWVGVELSAACWNQLLVPAGYAHGFVTIEPDTEVIYKVSQPYSREHERAIRFDDPCLAIAWPVLAADMLFSDKDSLAPTLDAADLTELMEVSV